MIEQRKVGPKGTLLNLWADYAALDDTAKEQIASVALHPATVGPLAVMPDCHGGYGVPVGTVWRTDGSVVPNAVGVDIGCGVRALRTSATIDQCNGPEFWTRFEENVRLFVPVGPRNRGEAMAVPSLLHVRQLAVPDQDVRQQIGHSYEYQLGTLGSGNHFLEAARDSDGYIWLLVHSGSRGAGHALGTWYAAQARQLALVNEERHYPIDLEPLPLDTDLGQAYLADMRWACEYATENRMLMGNYLYSALTRAMLQSGMKPSGVQIETVLDVPHNYAIQDFERPTVLHRKGATSAERNEHGIVPGSMGTPTYIVRGRGNPDSLQSCSHGAGRIMGRGQARRTISEADFAESLAQTYSRPSLDTLDEAPGAYKDIRQVMDAQADLVSVEQQLKPIITVKGGVFFKGKRKKEQAGTPA